MPLPVKEIIECVTDYTHQPEGKVNATTKFKKTTNDNLAQIRQVLGNGAATSTDLITALDDLVYTILDYRYNIVDYGHYSDDDIDNGRRHLRITKG